MSDRMGKGPGSVRSHAGVLQKIPVSELGRQMFCIPTALGVRRITVQGSHDLRKYDVGIEQVIVSFPGMLRSTGPQRAGARIYPGCYDAAAILAAGAARNTAAFAMQFLTAADDTYGRNLAESDVLLYDVEGWKEGSRSIGSEQIGTYEVVDSFLGHLRTVYPAMDRAVLFGNSAGGQFLVRYAAYGNAPGILGPAIELAIGSSNGSSYPYLDRWRGKTVEQVRMFSRRHGLDVDCSPGEIAKIEQWRWGPKIPPGVDGMDFLRCVKPDQALRRLLRIQLFILAGRRDSQVRAMGLQDDLPSMVQGFKREDFNSRGERLDRPGRICDPDDYGRYARAWGFDFWLGLRADDLGVDRVGRMVSVDAGHDSDAMASDRAVQQTLFGGLEYVRSSPLPLEEFSPVDPVR